MTTRIEDLWKEALQYVRDHPLAPNGFRLLRIDPEASFDVYAGIDASSFVILAIGVHLRPPNVELESSSLDYFRQQRQDGSWLMALRLRQLGLEPVFGRLCQDLVDTANGVGDEKELISLFRDRLNLWRRLFLQGANGLLQIYQIKGLVAELLVLEDMLKDGKRGQAEIVIGWKGPIRGEQDFLFSDLAIEVKAIGPGVDAVSISSLNQLDASVPMSLLVMVLRQASPGEHGAISLNGLVTRIEEFIVPNPEVLRHFRERLLEAGYVEHEFYDTVLFEDMSWSTFYVRRDFPRLVPNVVPAGIESASYAITLDSIGAFKVEGGENAE